MRRMRVGNLQVPAVLTVLLGLMAGAAHGEVIVKERTEYYSISGKSGAELGRAMLKGGRGTINKRHAIAATAAKYDIGDADIVVANGRCVVRDVRVTLHLTYYYPRWRGRQHARASLRKAWDQFYAELQRHEKQHGKIARDGARELEAMLKQLSGTTAFRCSDFGIFADARLTFLARRIRQRQLAFDRRENLAASRISRLQAALVDAY